MKYLILILSFVSLSAFAGSGDKSTGCGLGWEVTKSISWFGTTTRGSTNATFSNTIGMTLGTSGCAKHSIVLNKAKSVHYVHSNYLALMQDMARGQGEYLTGFAKTFGCSEGSLDSFTQIGKSNYNALIQSTSPAGLTNEMRNLLVSDKNLAKNCSNLL
jgi:hypothetical protein